MRVLIVSNLYRPSVSGGAEKVAQGLAESLATRGHDVAVATLENPLGRPDLKSVSGIRVYSLPIKNLYLSIPNGKRKRFFLRRIWHALDMYNPLMASCVGPVLEKEQPDVVNTHNIAGFSASAWSAVKRRGLPLVHTAHDFYAVCANTMMFRNGRSCPGVCRSCRAYTCFRREMSGLVDVLVAPSRFVLDEHVRFGAFSNAERIAIHNAYSVPQDAVSDNLREGPVRFGYLGRLHPTKGVDLLIRSIMELPPGRAELWIAGRGRADYEPRLRRMAEGRPDIRWLGFVPPDELLRQVDVLVVPSLLRDSAPLVVLEGMSHGIPIIGSCRGGIPELMGYGTGWVFDPGDPGALTRALKRAIESRIDFKAMSERAVQRAHHFSTQAMVDGYLRAYSRAIEKNSKNSERG